MSEQYEISIAEFESERNEALDSHFKARPHIERSVDNEKLVEAGFRLGWEAKNKSITDKLPTDLNVSDGLEITDKLGNHFLFKNKGCYIKVK